MKINVKHIIERKLADTGIKTLGQLKKYQAKTKLSLILFWHDGELWLREIDR